MYITPLATSTMKPQKKTQNIIIPDCPGAARAISNFILHFTGVCDWLFMLGLKLNHVSERGPRKLTQAMLNKYKLVDNPLGKMKKNHKWAKIDPHLSS